MSATATQSDVMEENRAHGTSRVTRYRFGFVLTTAAGNMTRYLNLRKYADRDEEVECIWAPVSHYMEPGYYPRIPEWFRNHMIARNQAQMVTRQLSQLDMVMYHVFEPHLAAALRSYFRPLPLLAWSADNPPVTDPKTFPPYSHIARSGWKRHRRLRLDRFILKRTAQFFPFSHWAEDILVRDFHIPTERVHTIHVGLDLEQWPYIPPAGAQAGGWAGNRQARRSQILFVGGNFQRKGGDLLLNVYRRAFADRADLHLVTQEPPPDLPPGVSVYTDLKPNDPRLRQLYAACDLFVLPTRADLSSWVALEAMATGRPVITTRTGGVPDIVDDGETGFLIDIEDEASLQSRMETLLGNADLRERMGRAGRAKAEREFSAAVNVPRILGLMKSAVDAQRSLTGPQK